MLFRVFHDEASGALSYLLGDRQRGEALLIDPRASDVPVLLALLSEQRLRLRGWLRTHHHDDLHPGEAAALAALPGPQRGASCAASGTAVSSAAADLHLGGAPVQVLATPGHTADCRSFWWRDRLFCGGLLAVDACPSQPHPSDAAALWDSVQRLFRLPAETLLFVGQAGPAAQRRRIVSLLHEERRDNPWFARSGRDEFLARVARLSAPARRASPLALSPSTGG